MIPFVLGLLVGAAGMWALLRYGPMLLTKLSGKAP